MIFRTCIQVGYVARGLTLPKDVEGCVSPKMFWTKNPSLKGRKFVPFRRAPVVSYSTLGGVEIFSGMISNVKDWYTPLKTNMSPQNQWLEDVLGGVWTHKIFGRLVIFTGIIAWSLLRYVQNPPMHHCRLELCMFIAFHTWAAFLGEGRGAMGLPVHESSSIWCWKNGSFYSTKNWPG